MTTNNTKKIPRTTQSWRCRHENYILKKNRGGGGGRSVYREDQIHAVVHLERSKAVSKYIVYSCIHDATTDQRHVNLIFWNKPANIEQILLLPPSALLLPPPHLFVVVVFCFVFCFLSVQTAHLGAAFTR